MTRSHPEPRALGGGEARRGSVRCSSRAGVGTEEAAASERASQGSTHVVGGERVLQLGFVAGGVPEESQAAADAESPRAGAKRERDLCDIPASLLLPLLAAKRRSGWDSSSGMSHVRLPPAHGGRERERAEADRIWEARAPETCQIRSVAAIPRTAATGSGVSQLPWPPPRLSSPPPRRFARLSSSAAITLQGERHARQVRGSPDGCEKERE